MLLRFIFNQMSLTSQAQFMKKRGVSIGSRVKYGREYFMYMYHDLFAEIVFKNDNPEESAEEIQLVSGLPNLTRHLEREIRMGSILKA